jgi:site-specific DNA-methyltransferase (adenine-specific)
MEQGHTGHMPYSWFYFDLVKNITTEKTSHPCQIPLGLFSLPLNASTCEGDDVLILFGGSGTEIMLYRKFHRNFISCESHPQYYQMILSRLSGFPDLSSSASSSFPADLLPDRPENETLLQLSLFTSR